MGQPVAPMTVQPPVPSILTTARDRTGDGFGAGNAPSPPADAMPEGQEARTRAAWLRGVDFADWSCQRSYPWRDCNPTVDAGDPNTWKSRSDGAELVSSAIFHLYTPVECDQAANVGFLRNAARELAEANTAFGLARALWMGEGLPDVVSQPTLQRTAVDVSIGGDAADLDDVVSQLLAAYEIGTHGKGGAMLHIPGILSTQATGGGGGGATIARQEGQVYRGPNGSVVSFGPGYPFGLSTAGTAGYGPRTGGTEPTETYAGSASDEVWVFVSGPVEYALGPVEITDVREGGILRRNSAEILAERPAVFRFSPCSVWAARALSPFGLGS